MPCSAWYCSSLCEIRSAGPHDMARRVAPPRTSGVHSSFHITTGGTSCCVRSSPGFTHLDVPSVSAVCRAQPVPHQAGRRPTSYEPLRRRVHIGGDGCWGVAGRDARAGERAAVGSRGPRTARSRTPPRGLAAIPQLFEHRHLDPHDHGGPQFEGCGLKYRWLEGVSSITNSSVTFPGSVNLRGRELQDVTERVRYPVQRSERYVRLRRCESIVRGGGV